MQSFPPWLTRIGDWIFRGSAMRTARARVQKPTGDTQRAFNQARLLMEVARRVSEPVEALPKGSRAAVLVALYRDAAYWALIASSGLPFDADGAAPDRAAAWGGAAPEYLSKAAGTAAHLETTRGLFLDGSPAKDLEATDQDVTRLRGLAEALLWELDAPKREIERVQVQRWTRTIALLCLVAVAGSGVRLLLRGPNLVADKHFKTSSIFAECTPPNKCADIFFCTANQENPWIDFDLGAVKPVHRVEVKNRSDCCGERAVPLIVEVSLDDKQWTQVARRDAEFSEFAATFPKRKARYVRFRVPRFSLLHFDDVAIR